MTQLKVDILDPKAERLLKDLADLNLIAISEITNNPSKKGKTEKKKMNAMQEYLLTWPKMTVEEKKIIKENRNRFNEWK